MTFFSFRKVGQCSFCEMKFETAPVELPCKHLLCNSCYRDTCYGNHVNAKCPQCEAPVPPTFDPSTTQNRNRYELTMYAVFCELLYLKMKKCACVLKIDKWCDTCVQACMCACAHIMCSYSINKPENKLERKKKG